MRLGKGNCSLTIGSATGSESVEAVELERARRFIADKF
jgi:hypothetical protein